MLTLSHAVPASILTLCVLTCSCRTLPPSAASPWRPAGPLDDQAYIGLRLREDGASGRTLVSWVYPGPLEGTGWGSALLDRGDTLLAVDGKPVDSKGFQARLDQAKPGDTMVLKVDKTGSTKVTSVPEAAVEGVTVWIPVGLGARADWCGPVAFPRSAQAPDLRLAGPPGKERPDYANVLEAAIRDNGVWEPYEKLVALLGETQDETAGFHSLSRVARAFYDPLGLWRTQCDITGPLAQIVRDPRGILRESAANLDATAPPVQDKLDLSDALPALERVAAAVTNAAAAVESAFRGLQPEAPAAMAQAFHEFMAASAEHGTPFYSKDGVRFIRTIQMSMAVDYDALLAAAGAVSGLMLKSDPPALDSPGVRLPKALRRAVGGSVLAVLHHEGRWFVYGGPGPNSYDMGVLDGVVDAGGDDTYAYPAFGREHWRSVQVIVDMGGDDRYEAVDVGPAAAIAGVSLLVDYAGNDHYSGTHAACGVGILGVGILLDRHGSDTYTCTSWGQGAAIYGVGALLDLGGGHDTYLAHTYSQGIGGARGFGVIVEQSGNDLYRANGPVGSAYGDAAVYLGQSQGVGLGMRGFDTGGIGVICDLSGSDRYEAGEFSQGGGYYWGLGILYDRNGNDLYYGGRYSQGFGCHQAAGVLADDAGDDTYWAMTAASQGAAWDLAVGLLVDQAGDDAYRANGLSQGGAAQQGVGCLLDLAGTDRYTAGKARVHGESSGNRYHFDTSGCFSFSLLFDGGGTDDIYSSGRTNGVTVTTGRRNEEKLADSGLHGLFMDTPEPLELPVP